MSTHIKPSFDIKKFREDIIERRGARRAKKEQAERIAKDFKELFDSYTEDKIIMMEKFGVDVRNLLSYDLKRASEDPEYNRLFQEEYSKVLEKISSKMEAARSDHM